MKNFATYNFDIVKELLIVISSFSLAFGVVLKHEAETRVSITLGIFLTILGFIFFISMTKLINKILLSTTYGLEFIKKFQLSMSDCIDITNK